MEVICTGHQSVTPSAERLKDHACLPIDWDAQQRLLSDKALVGFELTRAGVQEFQTKSHWPSGPVPESGARAQFDFAAEGAK